MGTGQTFGNRKQDMTYTHGTIQDPLVHGDTMTVCPVAIAVGCQKCPIFKACPVKSVIGDHKIDPDSNPADAGKNKPS